MRFAGPIRQEIGIRTLMNVLGPMTNPAGAKRQVIGVFSQAWQHKVAQVLQLLGSEHALVVHSNGLDEIRLDAPTHVVELKHGDITEYDISPEQFGIAPKTPEEHADIIADSAETSLALVKQSLTDDSSAAADIVLSTRAPRFTSAASLALWPTVSRWPKTRFPVGLPMSVWPN